MKSMGTMGTQYTLTLEESVKLTSFIGWWDQKSDY